MYKSPLRELAEAYAQKELSLEDYREQRRRLLDAIEDGDIKLPNASAATPPATSKNGSPETPPHPRVSPKAMAMAGTLLLALLVWFLVPRTVFKHAPDTIASPANAPYVSPEQLLLEQFLSANLWDQATLDNFEIHWQELPEQARFLAQAKPWYQRMKNALNRELNAQKAIAALTSSKDNQANIARLISFGMMLGIKELKPLFSEPLAVPSEILANSSPPSLENIAPVEEANLNGARWLNIQANEHFSLQLFAVNHLHKVERLITRFPELELKLVPLERANPRFRLLYGIFSSREAAQTAYNALPEALRLEQPKPIIKTMQELKAGLEKTTKQI